MFENYTLLVIRGGSLNVRFWTFHRKNAFRYTPGVSEKSDDLDSEQDDSSPISPIPPALAKTSSSEWNSSDDLVGPFSEQEDAGTVHVDSLSRKTTLGSNLSGIYAVASMLPARLSPRNEPTNGPLVPSHNTLQRWLETPTEHRLSSDASSKSGSSDQDRNDLSASESDDRLPSPNPRPGDGTDSLSQTEKVLPTTFFSVDSCMTDTYRAKYHKKPSLYRKAEDHTSSGESDAEGRGISVMKVPPPVPSRNRTDAGK